MLDALLKLNPRNMMAQSRSCLWWRLAALSPRCCFFDGGADFSFNLQITLWLWFTVLFANFAEAMAEGRGKAQADTLRKARSETMANRLLADGKVEQIAELQAASRATWCWLRGRIHSLAMAKSSKASHRWTNRRSPANPRP